MKRTITWQHEFTFTNSRGHVNTYMVDLIITGGKLKIHDRKRLMAAVTFVETIGDKILFVEPFLEEIATAFYHRMLRFLEPENITWFHFNPYLNVNCPDDLDNLQLVTLDFDPQTGKFMNPVWSHLY